MDTAEPLTDPAGAFGDMLYDDWQALEGDMWWSDREPLGVVGAAGGVCGVSADPFGKWPTDAALHPADHSLAYTDGLDALIGPGTAGSLTLERGAWALPIAAPSPDDVETEWPLATAAPMGAEPADGTVAVEDPQAFAPYDPSSILDPMSVPESSAWSVTNPTHCTDGGEAPDASEPFGPIDPLAAANQWVASSSSSVPHTSPHIPDAQSNPIPKAIPDPSPSSLDGPDALVVSEAAAVPMMPSPPPDSTAAPSDGDPGWTGWPPSTPPTQPLAEPSDALLQCSDAIPADAASSIPAALTYDSLIPSEAAPDGPAVDPGAVPTATAASPDGDPVPEGLPSTPADGHTDFVAEEEGNNSDLFYMDVTGVSAHANAAVASEPSPLDTGDEGDGEAPPSVSRLDPMTGLPLLDLAVPPPYDSGSSDPSLWSTHDPAESSAFSPTTGWMDAPGSAAPGWAPQGAACGWPGGPSPGTPWDWWSGWQSPSWGPPVYHQPPPKPPLPLNETELKKRVGAELQWSFARVEELLAAKLITPEERNRRRETLATQQTAKHRAAHEAAVAKYLRATAAAAAAAAAAESYNWGPQFSSWDWAAPSSLNGPPRTGYSAPATGASQGGNVTPAVRPDVICLGYSKPPAKVESPPKPQVVKPTPPTPPPSAPSRRQQEGSGNAKLVQRQRPSTESAGGPLPLQDSSSTEPAPPAKRARSEASSEAWGGWGTWEGGCWGAGGGRGWSDTQDKVLCAAHQKLRSPASVVAKGDGWVCTEEFRCRAGTADGDVGELQLCTTHNRTRASIHLSHGSDGLWRCRPGKECRDGAGVGWGDWGGASDEPAPGPDAAHDIHI